MSRSSEDKMANLTQTVFGSAEQVFLDSKGFVYYPLLLDKSIEHEAKRCKEIKNIDGRAYIKGLNLDKIISSFDKIDNRAYKKIKDDILAKVMPNIDLKRVYETGDYKIIRTIVFEVMPYFLDKNKKRNPLEIKKQRKLTEEDILGLIKENITIPQSYYAEAKKFYSLDDSQKLLGKIKKLKIKGQKFPEGMIKTGSFEPILKGALETYILNEKVQGMEKEIQLKKEILKKSLDYAATILYLKNTDKFEIGDFGFIRNQDGYTPYIKTGEYALRDFNGKVYRFPPCRVGVKISRDWSIDSMHPRVLDKYGHPFLPYSCGNQNICIGNARVEGRSLSEKAISSLEKGMNAILFGYFKGNNNYHHDLCNFPHRRVSEKSPKIKSGKVKITNDPFIEKDLDKYYQHDGH